MARGSPRNIQHGSQSFIQRSNLRSKMADEETQAGSPPVVVPNSIEQSLRDQFERILLISEEAAASLAEQVMEVFTEKEEQAQQLTGRCQDPWGELLFRGCGLAPCAMAANLGAHLDPRENGADSDRIISAMDPLHDRHRAPPLPLRTTPYSGRTQRVGDLLCPSSEIATKRLQQMVPSQDARTRTAAATRRKYR